MGEYHREPFVADVAEGKNDPVYLAHGYHTKVPYRAIMRYILHYTKPHDLVFDGFAGSGMTALAASACASSEEVKKLNLTDVSFDIGPRNCILSEISPAATHVAHNFNSCTTKRLFAAVREALDALNQKWRWMFETNHVAKNGSIEKGFIHYVVWSEVLICPNCTNEFVFWEQAIDKQEGTVKAEFICPSCGKQLKSIIVSATVTQFDRESSSFFRSQASACAN